MTPYVLRGVANLYCGLNHLGARMLKHRPFESFANKDQRWPFIGVGIGVLARKLVVDRWRNQTTTAGVLLLVYKQSCQNDWKGQERAKRAFFAESNEHKKGEEYR